jgi:hypothetical protein
MAGAPIALQNCWTKTGRRAAVEGCGDDRSGTEPPMIPAASMVEVYVLYSNASQAYWSSCLQPIPSDFSKFAIESHEGYQLRPLWMTRKVLIRYISLKSETFGH